ncbi:MAG: hypothetical protein K1T65_03785 [Candidatus Aramenus sp.]|nr:hypothetical protein [Candidatus Aramenus sp.]
MQILLPTEGLYGRIVEVRVDKEYTPEFSPDAIPLGSKKMVLNINHNFRKGKHIIEVITDRGNYLRLQIEI